MQKVIELFQRIAGRIPVRGTITTPSGEEVYPVAISNEIMGGPFIVDSLDQLKEIPVERMVKGCKCTVNEHESGDGKELTTTYMLKNIPSDRLSDLPGVNISDYWILDRPQQQDESAIETQYSANYEGKKPPFLSNVISRDAYNAGYATDGDFIEGDTSKKIWASTFDAVVHKWVRQRTGTLADWGIPVSIDDGYEDGAYGDIQFQWRLKSLGEPARPSSMVDGQPNNNPVGWEDTPDVPEGTDYETHILTHDLWRISATKGVYGDLLSEWTTPILVSTDPQLVRYGVDAHNNDYLNSEYWRPYYSPGDRFKASRKTISLPWVVERITGESGEYIDYVFKEFIDSYEPVIADAPTSVLGYGIDGWRDGVFETQEGYTLYVSTARKFSDGTISEPWTLPVRYDGKSTIRAVVVPKGDTGHSFKYVQSGGSQVVSPLSLTLEAKLFEASKRVEASKITSVQWYKGSVETGTLIPKLPIGVEPFRQPQYGGENDTELTIFPENVSGTQEFTARVYLNGEDYIDPIDVVDLTDGVGYQVLIDSSTGFIYKGSENKTFTAYLYENGIDVTSANGITFEWVLGGTSEGSGRTLEVSDSKVSGITDLVLNITLNGTTYFRTESLTDIADGKSIERQYSAQENMETSWNPDTAGNPGNFSTSSEDAIWAIDRVEDEDWGIVYRIKGEKGTPSGAFQMTVYRTREAGTTPSWLNEKPNSKIYPPGTLIPDSWTSEPESNASTGSEIYGSRATFIKSVATEDTSEIVANWNITADGWSLPYKMTHFPPAGSNGDPGIDGDAGWSPIWQTVSYTSNGVEERLLKLKEWTGGTGAKPGGEGYYLGTSGLVASPSSATNFKGDQGTKGDKGDDGVFDAADFWDGPWERYRAYEGVSGHSGSAQLEIATRLTKAGTVHFVVGCVGHPTAGDVSFNQRTFFSDSNSVYLPMSHLPTNSPVLSDVISSNLWYSFMSSTDGQYNEKFVITSGGNVSFLSRQGRRYVLKGTWHTSKALD